MLDSTWLMEQAGKYKTLITQTFVAAGQTAPIALPNPRRVMIRLQQVGSGAGGVLVMPDNQGSLPVGTGGAPPPQQFTLRDAPSLCQGGWSGNGIAGVSYVVWEVIYTGE